MVIKDALSFLKQNTSSSESDNGDTHIWIEAQGLGFCRTA